MEPVEHPRLPISPPPPPMVSFVSDLPLILSVSHAVTVFSVDFFFSGIVPGVFSIF